MLPRYVDFGRDCRRRVGGGQNTHPAPTFNWKSKCRLSWSKGRKPIKVRRSMYMLSMI
ncbi:MAG: hypothetical protein LBC70_07710 [Chitinispirillales bacterium]|nr:hypothetical protein [Chitinispirillales bacterium]